MILLSSPHDALIKIASLFKQKRLEANLTQAELSKRANVPLATLRKFEKTGKIALESFIKLAFILDVHQDILAALKQTKEKITSLDDLLKEEKPQRQRASSKKDKK